VGDGEDTELLDLLQGDGTLPEENVYNGGLRRVTLRGAAGATCRSCSAMC